MCVCLTVCVCLAVPRQLRMAHGVGVSKLWPLEKYARFVTSTTAGEAKKDGVWKVYSSFSASLKLDKWMFTHTNVDILLYTEP